MILNKTLFLCVLYVFLKGAWSRNALPDKTTSTFTGQVLTEHNTRRALHQNTGPLVYDNDIEAYAKTRCNTTSQSPGLTNEHHGLNLAYGENLWFVESSNNLTITGSMPLVAWYNNEIKYYNYSNPKFYEAAGHFTQVVWKATTNVGCAVCGAYTNPYYENYVVCNYKPAGNTAYTSDYAKNVQPLISSG